MKLINNQDQHAEVSHEELRPADIILVHTRRSLWGWLIRYGTHCYWNHALMVYSTGEEGQDYHNTLVVDAKTDGSIILRKLSDYVTRPDKYDVAVKRMNKELLDDIQVTDLLNNICRIAANEVQTDLARRLFRIKNQILRECIVIWRFVRKKLHKACTRQNLPWNIRPSQVKAFTCGGFVQWCYYMGVSGTVTENQDNRKHEYDVIFNSRITDNPTPFELLTTTPADLANCDKLSWVYAGKR